MSMNVNYVNPLQQNLINLLSNDRSPLRTSADADALATSFSDILSESMKTAALADSEDKYSTLQLIAGQSDDLSGLLLDAQKAELSLNLALQIRNKVIDAYNEIMRMQV